VNIQRKLLDTKLKIDWLLIILTFLLMSCGIVLVYSATQNSSDVFYKTYWFRQIIYFIVGSFAAAIISLIKIDYFKRLAFPMYFLSLAGLVFILFSGGDLVKGATRWIDLGFFKIQPSEFAKLAYLIVYSHWLAKHPVSFFNLKSFAVPTILFLVPFALVLRQPDLSTALVFIAISLSCFYWVGLTTLDMFLLISPFLSVLLSISKFAYSQFFWGFLICLVTLTLFYRKLPKLVTSVFFLANVFAGYVSSMVWALLKPHQQKRVETFLDPMNDPLGDGYQVLQSMTAIGSGGTYGKGFGAGSQTNLSFLPEEHTDFIFSVLGEQFGFLGSLLILILFFLFLWRALSISKLYEEPFVNLMVVSVTSVFFFHIIVNIAMTLGLMPVTGLPLPFLSYGGSFAIASVVMVGFLLAMRYQGGNR